MVQGLNTGYNQYQMQKLQTALPVQNKSTQNAAVQNTQANDAAPAIYTTPYTQSVPAQGYQMYTVPPKIVYNQNLTSSPNSSMQVAPLSNIPIQQDALSLTTEYSKDKEINLHDPAKNMTQQPLNAAPSHNSSNNPNITDSSLNAQMPAPNIKTEQAIQQTSTLAGNEAVNAEENAQEKILPSLNVGVVDAPNNASLTPITDDLNSRAQDIERTYIPNPAKSTSSLVPQALGKKPLNAGKMSAYLMFGSLGIASLMVIPKGISKIIKLIKHK